MIRLHISDDNIRVELSCEDSENHSRILNLVNELVREAYNHNGLSLSIDSTNNVEDMNDNQELE